MNDRAIRASGATLAVGSVLIALVALAISPPTRADESRWTIRFQPTLVTPHGLDRHVLTVRAFDQDPTPTTESKSAVNLDTDSGVALRAGLHYRATRWDWGVDVFWFTAKQGGADRQLAADGASGSVDLLTFGVADRIYASTDFGEVLFYEVLEDTELATWTVDLSGTRTLLEGPNGEIAVQLGLRLGDFDNDYRVAVGVRDAIGTRIDASSNYDRMSGPLVGLLGRIVRGKHSVEGYLGQSVLLGNAQLSVMARDFTGTFSATPSYVSEELFRREEDAAIPVTELRVKWVYRMTGAWALTVGADASSWWDVPIPPGVRAGAGGEALDESTLVYMGLSGGLELTF